MIETSAAIQEVAALSAQAAEIEKQHQAVMEEIRRKREYARGEAVLAAQDLIVQFQLTAADLKLAPAKRRAKRGEKKSRGTAAPKYRSPDGTSTWAGRGKRPQWFTAAIAGGQSAESMLIASAPAA